MSHLRPGRSLETTLFFEHEMLCAVMLIVCPMSLKVTLLLEDLRRSSWHCMHLRSRHVRLRHNGHGCFLFFARAFVVTAKWCGVNRS